MASGPAPDRRDLRCKVLASGPGLVARLIHYRPGLDQPTHEHGTTQLSFLILGEVEERVGRRQARSSGPSAGLKRAGTAHAARFGPAGALILSIEPTGGDAWDLLPALEPCRWYPFGAPVRMLTLAAMRMPAGVGRDDVLHDLMACAGAGAGGPPPDVAPWLVRVREHIRDDPCAVDVATLARETGVHRVHLSRSFHRAFGMPPSVYRGRCLAARAVARMVDGDDDLASLAGDCGYSDQAHLTRSLRRHAGLTPRRLRACLA